MKKTHTLGLIITGDDKGGVNVIQANREELERFDKQTKKSKKSAKEFGATVKGSVRDLTAYAAGLVGVATAGAAYIAYNAEQIKQQHMISEAYGVSAQKLAGLSYAARDTMISQEKMGDILKDTSEKIGDYLVSGGGEAADVIERLNLDVKELATLSPDQQLFKIAEGLEQIGSRSEKIALLEMLANDTSMLLPLLENNAEGLRENQREAEILGIALSDIDSSMIAQSASDTDRLWKAIGGGVNLLTAELSPAFGALSDEIVDTWIESDKLRTSSDGLTESMVNGTALVVDGFHTVRKAIGAVHTDVLGAYAQYKELQYEIVSTASFFVSDEKLAQKQKAYIDAFNAHGDALREQSKLLSQTPGADLLESLTARIDAYKLEAQYKQDLIDLGFEENEVIGDSLKVTEEKSKLLAAQAKEWDSIADSVLDVIEAEEKALEKLEARKQSADDWLDSEAQWNKDLNALGFGAAADRAEEQEKEMLKRRTKEYEQMAGRVDDVFVTLWSDVIDGTGNAFDMMQNMFKQMLAEMAHAAITKPIVVSVMGSIGLGSSGSAMAGAESSGGIGLGDAASLFGTGSSASFFQAGLSAYSSGVGFAGANGAIGGMASAGQYGAAASTAAGAYLPVIGGALYGYQEGGLGGAAMGGGGAYIGATVGSAFGPIGTAIGALIGGIAGAKAFNGITGGEWEYHDNGLNLDASASGLDAKSYLTEGRDGGWFRSSQRRTTHKDEKQIEQSLSGVVGGVISGIRDDATALGFGFSSSFKTAVNIGLKGLNEEEAAKALQGGLVTIYSNAVNSASGLNGYLKQFEQAGEQSYQTMDRVISQYEYVDSAVELVNQSIGELSQLSVIAADNLLNMSGGLELFSASSAAYYNEFFSEDEKNIRFTEDLTQALADQNIALPNAREGYRALVEGLDLMTESGQEQYASMLNLSASADIYYDRLDSEQERLDQVQGQLVSALDVAYSGLVGAATGSDSISYMAAQSSLSLVLGGAKSGEAVNLDSISDALSAVSNNSIDNYASTTDYNRDQLITANIVDELLNYATGTSTVEDQMLTELQSMREDLASLSGVMSSGNFASAASLQQIAKVFKKWDVDGQPEVRT